MRPLSSHTTQAPQDDPRHQHGTSSRQRPGSLDQHAHHDHHTRPGFVSGSGSDSDFDSDASTGTNDKSVSRHQSARSQLLARAVGASSAGPGPAHMTATSADAPGASSPSCHFQSSRQSPKSRCVPSDAESDVDMTDSESDSEASEADFEAGGAPLALAALTRANHATANTMPTAGSDSEYLSDADQQEYDEDDSDEDMQPPPYHPNTLPPMALAPLLPLPGNAYFLQNPHPNMQQLPIDPLTFAMPSGPTDLANLPPLPQPPPNWVHLPPVIGGPNFGVSAGNPAILGSENLDLSDFLRDWSYQGRFGLAARSQPPLLDEIVRQTQEQPEEIDFSQLKGDQYDVQGLDWTSMETTRKAARLRRQYTYRNYAPAATVSPRESFYRFKRMNIRTDIRLAHFQLRSVLACPTRTHAYYPTRQGIARMNLASRKSETFLNTRDFPANGAVISTVDADCGVLMCGTFGGEYYIKNLDASEKQAYSEGQITTDPAGITNHVKIHKPRRSCGPAAAIASNDHGFRLLDLETQTIIQEKLYPFALNCTAVSPDRRLRTVVGDHCEVLITNADTGEILQKLKGHRDYGFACDWSDDGWTVATGFQDMAVKIWDARRWCNSSGASTPLCTIRTEMAGARSLRFSPLGSGPPVLVAAEEADFVNIIDAKMFHYKQEIDVFGEIGGVAFANDGQDLNVLCCDTHRGGLLQLERCRGRRGFRRSYDDESLANRHSWLPDTDTTPAMHEIPALF